MSATVSSDNPDRLGTSFNVILFCSYAGILVICLVIALQNHWGTSDMAHSLLADDRSRIGQEAQALLTLIFEGTPKDDAPQLMQRASQLKNIPTFRDASRLTIHDEQGRSLDPAEAPPLEKSVFDDPMIAAGRPVARLADDENPEDSPVSFTLPVDLSRQRTVYVSFVLPPMRSKALLRALNSGQHAFLILVLSLICWSSLAIVFLSYRKLRTAHDELRRTQAVLIEQEKVRAITQASGGLAHQLNQPLGVIKGYCELIRLAETTEAATAHATVIDTQVDRAAGIIDRLQEMTRFKTIPYVDDSILDLSSGSDGQAQMNVPETLKRQIEDEQGDDPR